MRNRSVTIYASNEEEYKAQMPLNGSPSESPKQGRKKSSKFSHQIESMNTSLNNSIREEEINNSDDMLSFIKNFSLEQKKPSLKEQLIEDEEELKMKLLNLNSKGKEKILNYKRISSNKQSNSTFDCSNNALITCDDEINSILKYEEKLVKCLLLGDKQVGKSLFKSKILDEHSVCQPTTTLEIKKKNLFLGNAPVRLEVVDTNLQIQSSPIIQTYYKVCNLFLFFCDADNTESIHYLQKQIDKVVAVRKSLVNKAFILVNTKQTNGILSKSRKVNKDLLDAISSKYNIQYDFIDLSNLVFSEVNRALVSNNISIQKFLNEIIN